MSGPGLISRLYFLCLGVGKWDGDTYNANKFTF